MNEASSEKRGVLRGEEARVLGLDHPNTLASRDNLAGAYGSVGDLVRAIPLYEQTLADRTPVLGPDHPDTLASWNNLAGAYQAVGDSGRAIPLCEAVAADVTRVLGPDHPDTLTLRTTSLVPTRRWVIWGARSRCTRR